MMIAYYLGMESDDRKSTDDPRGRMEAFSVRLDTPDGPLRGQVGIFPGPTPLAGLVPPMLALCDGLVGLAVKRGHQDNKTVSCRAGCDACCYHLVPLSIPEVFFIRDVVKSLPPEQEAAVRSRFDANLDALAKSGLDTRISDGETTDDEHQQLALEYFYLGLPCPFLVNRQCSIYSRRPTACREYQVTSPAEHCSDPRAKAIEKLAPKVALPVVLTQLAAELLETRPRLVPLIMALDWAEKHAEWHRRAWPGKKLIELLLARLQGIR